MPAGTPPDVIKRFFDVAQVALAKPEVRTTLARDGSETVMSKSPKDFGAFPRDDNLFWARLVKGTPAARPN